MEYADSSILNTLVVSPTLKNKMQSVANWAKICSIGSLISQAIDLLAEIKSGNLFSGFLFTAIIVFLNVLLLNFARNLDAGLKINDEGLLSESFSNLRRYYLITSILMIFIGVIVFIGALFLMISNPR